MNQRVSKSASSLANELNDSIYEPKGSQFQNLAAKSEESEYTKPRDSNPNQTANLIAQAIIHQKQKQNGIEIEPEAPQEAPHSFAEQSHIDEVPFKPIVSKDELLES